MTYFYLFIIYCPKLLPRAFGTHRRVFWLLCEVRDVSFLCPGWTRRKWLLNPLRVHWHFLSNSSLSLVPPSTPIPYYLISFPSVFLFSQQDTSLLEGMGNTSECTLDFFFFSSYASLFTSLLRRQGVNWFLTSRISRLFFLFLLTPHNRLVICSSCYSWNLLEKATLSSLVKLVPTKWEQERRRKSRKEKKKEMKERRKGKSCYQRKDCETSGPPTLGRKGKRSFFALCPWSILSLLRQELQTS